MLHQKHYPLGRSWYTADRAALTKFVDGDAIVKLEWKDGNFVHETFNSHADAIAFLKRMGFNSEPK